MPEPDESPAVQSLKDEQAAQKKQTDSGDLQEGLENTFPASDPVSMTQTSIASGRADTDDGRYEAQRAELDALKAEVDRLTDSLSEIAGGTARLAKAEVKSRIDDFESKVRERPLMAVSLAAAIGYIWGATR